MLEVLSRHDPERVSVHGYSLGAREVEDAVTDAFRSHCVRFGRLDDLDPRSAAQAIADDNLDILVDLMCHSGSSRPVILLYKPAPVIITHLGSHGAIGLRQDDFKITSEQDHRRTSPLRTSPLRTSPRRTSPRRTSPAIRASRRVTVRGQLSATV